MLDMGLDAATVDSSGRKARRRTWLSRRVTLAHVAPVLLGMTAVVLVLAGLRDSASTVSIAVADHAIAIGQSVTSADVRWVVVHRGDGQVVGGLIEPARLGGDWVADVPIPQGAPIAAAELSLAADASGLGAMSIEISPARADGGALHAGDRVDVISVASGQAVYVATGLLVLAVGSGTSGVLGGTQDGSYFVTVAIDSATALRVAGAQGVSAVGTGSQVELVKAAASPVGGSGG